MIIKLLEGYDYNYYVSDDGRVFKEEQELSQSDNGIGYKFVHLKKNHKRLNRYVHRLVWQVFNGEIKNEINHIDHDKSNNKLSNLEEVTRTENMRKAVEFYGKEIFTTCKSSREKKEILYTCPLCGGVKSRSGKVCKKCISKVYNYCKPCKVSKEQLTQEMLKANSFVELGRIFGVTDNAVRKWCKKYDLPYKSKELKEWQKADKLTNPEISSKAS